MVKFLITTINYSYTNFKTPVLFITTGLFVDVYFSQFLVNLYIYKLL